MDILQTLEEIYEAHKRIDTESSNKYDNLSEILEHLVSKIS